MYRGDGRQKRPFSRDRLMMTARDDAASSALAALTPIQDEAPEIQVAGVSVLFAALSHRLGVDPEELYRVGIKMLTDEDFHHKGNIRVETLRDFAGLRLKGDEVVIR